MTTILKTFSAFMLLFTLVLVINSVTVSADSGETVRVSTSSELKKALKNSNVGTIIFKTPATLSVKISATNASKGKSLVIDAPNVTFTNKAVFGDINILSGDLTFRGTDTVEDAVNKLSDIKPHLSCHKQRKTFLFSPE